MRAWLLIAVVVLAGCDDDHAATPTLPAGTGVVEWVIDGDTIDVRIDGREERVRLLGVDTPEVTVEDGPPECYARDAAAYTAALLPVGTPVRLERDVVGRDDYGRLLAYVYRAGDGLDVNHELIRLGFARVLTIEPNGIHHQRYVDASRAAERAGLGLWAACAG